MNLTGLFTFQNENERVFAGIVIIAAPSAGPAESEGFIEPDGGRIADAHFENSAQYACFRGILQGCSHKKVAEALPAVFRSDGYIQDFHFIRRMIYSNVACKACTAFFRNAVGEEGSSRKGFGKGLLRPREIKTEAFK